MTDHFNNDFEDKTISKFLYKQGYQDYSGKLAYRTEPSDEAIMKIITGLTEEDMIKITKINYNKSNDGFIN